MAFGASPFVTHYHAFHVHHVTVQDSHSVLRLKMWR